MKNYVEIFSRTTNKGRGCSMVKIVILMMVFIFGLILNVTTIISTNRAYAESVNKKSPRRRGAGARHICGRTAEQACAAYSGGGGTEPVFNAEELWEAFGSPAVVSDLEVFSKHSGSRLFQYALLDMSKVLAEGSCFADKGERETESVCAGGVYFVVAKTDTIIRLLAAANGSGRAGDDKKAAALPERSCDISLEKAVQFTGEMCGNPAAELALEESNEPGDVWVWLKAGDICLGAPLWAAFVAVRNQKGGMPALEGVMGEDEDSYFAKGRVCFRELSAGADGA